MPTAPHQPRPASASTSGAEPTPGSAPAPTVPPEQTSPRAWDLPTVDEQAERLITLGVHEIAGLSEAEVRAAAARTDAGTSTGTDGTDVDTDAGTAPGNALLVLHPDRAPASRLAPLLERDGKRGFVVVDMPDVDDFRPIDSAAPPAEPVYAITEPERGDHMANWSPDEALPAITYAGRTPLTLTEGIHWLLQRPETLERNHCFMTIGSRLRKANGSLDSRTPAIWISNGTGRDGRDNRNAPKIGWCWAGNRHTWLGFASATTRP